jgi:uncharacterized protein involved in cysteine biosynthesis
MLPDLLRAFGELGDRRVRGVVWRGIGLAILTFIGLALGAEALIASLTETGYAWLDRAAELLGVLGTVVIAWFLFPATVVAISSFFLDRVVDVTEERYFRALPPAGGAPLAAAIPAAIRLFLLSLLLNLLALPLYFVPGLNIPLWLALNGYLVGREYFELVAMRRLPPADAARVRRTRRLRVWLDGIVVAALLAVPFVNLVAPIVGAAFTAQRYHRHAGDRPRRLGA